MKKGLLIVVSGPSGAGKGTVMGKLLETGKYALSISATTRKPREGEVDGKSYFFKTKEEFEQLIADKRLLEYACFCDNYYGTPLDYVQEQMNNGKNVILEIEVQGAMEVKKMLPDTVMIFMLPPSFEELHNRLVNRGTETIDVIEKRMSRAKEEVGLIENYDYVVVNEDIEDTASAIDKIVESEKSKVKHNVNTVNKILKGE